MGRYSVTPVRVKRAPAAVYSEPLGNNDTVPVGSDYASNVRVDAWDMSEATDVSYTGSMTAPNNEAVQRCIKSAVENAGINADEIDLINGHLTATIKDAAEINNWSVALNRKGNDFPYIHSLKSMTGHCLGAAGAIESVAAVLGLYHGFIFPSINCEDIHPDIASIIGEEKIPQQLIKTDTLQVIAKASFGFGDINSCIIFKKYNG